MADEPSTALDQVSTTMATVRSARERSTTSAARKRPVARARRVETSQRLGELLKLVSQPTRLRLLLALADGPKGTHQLCESLGQSRSVVGYHLALLRASRVVESRREDYRIHYQLTEPGSRFLNAALGLVDGDESLSESRITRAELRKLIKEVSTADDDPEEWLYSPNPQFEGRRPIDLIGTKDEIRVHIIIRAAEQGCFS
jgi:DNA-binding transcriptional ArsR family regulator